jgi:multidrug efflux pump subunit AcrA (membrane-fusion protein)
MKKHIVFITVFVCLSLSLGCSRKQNNPSAGPPEVLVTEVTRKDVPIVSESVATLDGLVNAIISARVSGHLISQDYKEGTVVRKGDPLFQIDPRMFEEAIAQAKANLERAQATQLKADQDEKRALDLFERKVTSEQERDTALQAAAASKGDTKANQAAVDSAQLNLEYTKITAPIDGVAGFATAQVGNLVGPNSDNKASMRPVKVGERFGQMWEIKEGLEPGEKEAYRRGCAEG